MSNWLDPIRNALDAAPEPATFFFRDDDAGWSDDRLFRLLDLFADYSLPIDLAVIPQALTPSLAHKICKRREASGDRIGVHQHGFAHKNHEPEGRKCEFGAARSRALQQHDIERGRELLAGLFGPIAQPIFTPPWNRCTAQTGACLAELGFSTLSRDHGAEPLKISGLLELPIRIDWFARSKGSRLDLNRVGALIADPIKDSCPIGIMFHHALMCAEERRAVGELLALLAAHNRARCRSMQSLAGAQLKAKAGQGPDLA